MLITSAEMIFFVTVKFLWSVIFHDVFFILCFSSDFIEVLQKQELGIHAADILTASKTKWHCSVFQKETNDLYPGISSFLKV